MGIYVFNTDAMYELLFQDAARRRRAITTSAATSSRR